MTTPRASSERGAVMVLVAAAMFPIVFLMAFAIDVSHWFDYSRNLQNRADAAALAAGDAYGNICFNTPGDKWTGAQSVIGKFAQLYSGPPNGSHTFDNGTNSAANLPYGPDSTVFGVQTPAATAYNNVPSLQLGVSTKYYMRLNADDYADGSNGGTGTNFSIGDFCNSNPALDKTDPNPGPAGAITDVKVTQEQLPYFVPVLKLLPNISAHARVYIAQVTAEKGVRPIGVRDASFTPCLYAYFLNNDGSRIQSNGVDVVAKLTKVPNTSPTAWTSAGNPVDLPIPPGNPVTVQMFLNNCSSTSLQGVPYDYYDDKGKDNQLGLVYINNWGNPTAPTANQPPVIWTGGVKLSGTLGTTCDPYFETDTGGCNVGVDAQVNFPSDSGKTFYVRAVNLTTGDTLGLTQGAGNDWNSGAVGLPIATASGTNNIGLQWAELCVGQTGSVNCQVTGSGTCDGTTNRNGTPNTTPFSGNKCTGTLKNPTGGNTVQRVFAGADGTNTCSPINNDTGPLRWITVGQTDNSGVVTVAAGANAFGGNTTASHVFVSAAIAGLSNAAPTDPDICLRVAEQDSHTTGFVDCGAPGQPGGSGDQAAIGTGCPELQKNTRVQADGSLTCTPAITPADCVQNDPGQSPPVLKGFDDLIGNPALGYSAPNNCAPNHWNKIDPSTGMLYDITLADPRAVVMIITAPVDFANGTGNIPIRDFAVFYVTGWSTGNGGVKGCTNNDPAPAGAGNGEIWGHWTSIVVPSGSGSSNGQGCNFNAFGNCIAVLTR